jgi:hypothetical protein
LSVEVVLAVGEAGNIHEPRTKYEAKAPAIGALDMPICVG